MVHPRMATAQLGHCCGNKYTDGTDIYFLVNGQIHDSLCEIEAKRRAVSFDSFYMTQEEWRNRKFKA